MLGLLAPFIKPILNGLKMDRNGSEWLAWKDTHFQNFVMGKEDIIGIDFGTEYSRVSVYKTNVVDVVPNEDGIYTFIWCCYVAHTN